MHPANNNTEVYLHKAVHV